MVHIVSECNNCVFKFRAKKGSSYCTSYFNTNSYNIDSDDHTILTAYWYNDMITIMIEIDTPANIYIKTLMYNLKTITYGPVASYAFTNKSGNRSIAYTYQVHGDIFKLVDYLESIVF